MVAALQCISSSSKIGPLYTQGSHNVDQTPLVGYCLWEYVILFTFHNSYPIPEFEPSTAIFWTEIDPSTDSKATQTRLHCSQVVVIAIVLYGRHYDLVGRNQISISQITTNLLLFTRIFLSPITAKSFTELD